MKSGKGISMYRVGGVVLGLILLSSSFVLFARALTYFNTGADPADALNILQVETSDHTPSLVWLPETPNDGRALDLYSRKKIESDYLFAWKTWNYSFNKGLDVNLKEHFSEHARRELLRIIDSTKGFNYQRVDISHNLKPHLFSLDGTFLSFTDKSVRLKLRYFDPATNKLIYRGEEVADYDVILMLVDGHWRVHQMVKKIGTEISDSTGTEKIENVTRLQNKKFHFNDQDFIARGVNYYPQSTPWLGFWPTYDDVIIEKDMALIQDLDLNVVRIFIQYEVWGKGNVENEYLDHLEHFLQICEEYDIKVIVTLFDFFTDYSLQSYPTTDRQLETIVRRFNTHPAVLAWDIKNEPDLDFERHGRLEVEDWLTFMTQRIRLYDPNHLITIGWAYPENAAILSDSVDFVSFHYYRDIDKLPSVVEGLKNEMPDKLLFLEEFGLSSFKFILKGHNEKDQSRYYERVLKMCRDQDLSFALWTLHDFSDVPGYIAGRGFWIRNTQKRFGLFRKNGSPKQAVEHIKN